MNARSIASAGIVAVVACLSACGGKSETGGVGATERDYAIDLATDHAPPGSVTFNVTNDGPSTHEFVVIRTDLAPESLPVEDGLVKEANLDLVGEKEDIPGGTSVSLTLDLTRGPYVLICNIPTHYENGMRTGFEVA